jgi:hypothetical protein
MLLGKWPAGFFIAGSSISEMNGLYIPVLRLELECISLAIFTIFDAFHSWASATTLCHKRAS